MRSFFLTGPLLGLAASLLSPAAAPPQAVLTVRLNGHTFTLPAGFTIELAARSPLVDRPIVADLDEHGRLYVADSSGSNEKVDQQLKKRPHRIVRLEDSDGDGVYDRRTVFADKMMFPEGAMWLDGSLYVSAPPHIWKLTDTDGDGVADRREVWFDGKTLTGCANDLHGPYAGLDGWIYWAKGAFAQQTVRRPGQADLVTRAAHLFRARPDGSGIEPVMTGGMDNPVDIVFTPGGERLFSTTFFQHPATGLRDGLVHAVHGGIYGKDQSVVYDPAHRWTGPGLMPVLTHMGPAAPCGLHRYESAAFGADYRDNLFACQFNLQKLSRHILWARGATFASRDSDFLVSDNRDFHPTDVIEDADGSLLVFDTGGWYKLCCPTSQLGKPDVLGAVYRVRRVGAPRPADPRGNKIEWAKATSAELAKWLADPRPVVRRRAVQELGRRGADAVAALDPVRRSGSAEARRNAIWAATRIEHPRARTLVRLGLRDADESVRQVAGHSVSLRRDAEAVSDLRALLKQPSAHNRRVAAEALGRIGDRRSVPNLLAALAQDNDRFLEHSLIYALIEIADREATARGMRHASARVRRAALIALDGMDGGKLNAADVARSLDATDPALREAAWWVAGRHPEWGGELAAVLQKRLEADLTPQQRDELVGMLGRFARAPAMQRLLAERLAAADASTRQKQLVLQAMARASLKQAPATWAAALLETLTTRDDELLRAALATARTVPLPPAAAGKLTPPLLELGRADKRPDDIRLAALAAVPGGLRKVEPAMLAFLLARVGGEQPVARRALAVDVLARAHLSPPQLGELTGALKSVGPMELDRLLEPFARSADESVGGKLVTALRTAPARTGLRVDGIRTRLAKYSPAVQKQVEALCAELDAEAVKQRARLDEALAALAPGDVRRGQAVFNSQKAACASCHAIGYLGGKVGPDLTRIGRIRSDRDLLESILFPSASFVRSYEPVDVTTLTGKVHSGLVRRDTPEEIELATGATEVVRVRRAEIEEIRPGKVSVMPTGMDKVLSAQELADLVAFLRACR